MSAVRNVLHALEVIGATIMPAGDHLVLRAGPKPVPASVIRLIREQRARAFNVVPPPARGMR